jgi:uroporphyrinogen III methyltransferase/synthase
MRIATIGPITSKTVRDQGLKVDVEAHRHDIDGLVQAIRELFEKS